MKIRVFEKAKTLLQNAKIKLQRNFKKGFLTTVMVAGVGASLLSGCAPQANNDAQVENSATTDQNDDQQSLEEQIAAMQAQLDALQQSAGYGNITASDSYTVEEWDEFVKGALASLDGVANNADEDSLEAATVLLNIDYLDATSKDTLLKHFVKGQDEEVELKQMYGVISQIREYNTEITSADDYYSMNNLLVDQKDQAIMSVLEDYAKEIITLKGNLTKENQARIQEIFDTMDEFFAGKGTISVTIDGKVEEIAKADLSNGGKVAAETVGQIISVQCKDIVSQKEREDLDKKLNTESLSEITKKISKYLGMTYNESLIVNAEALQEIVETYQQGVQLLTEEVKDMGVTAEEAQALCTVLNIENLIDMKVGDQTPFAEIYKDGININDLFKNAESAVRKIQTYNDTHEGRYGLERFILNADDVQAYAVVSGYSQNLEAITSPDKEVASAAAEIVKGFSQYSSEVTVDYEEVLEDGTAVSRSSDKNALSAGETFVVNVMTLTSIENHPSVYGDIADIVRPLVDGSQHGIDPTDEITLKITGECKARNIAVYDYEIENQK